MSFYKMCFRWKKVIRQVKISHQSNNDQNETRASGLVDQIMSQHFRYLKILISFLLSALLFAMKVLFIYFDRKSKNSKKEMKISKYLLYNWDKKKPQKNRPPTMLNKIFLVLSYMFLMIIPWEWHVNCIFLTVGCFKLISC